MQITNATEYAIRLILELSSRRDISQPVTIAEICRLQEIPEKFFRKFIIILINAGLIRSYRGPNGGLVLGRSPEEITLYDVIKVTEGAMNLNVCLISENECNRQNTCPVHKVWKKTQDAMLDVLNSANFKSLGREYNQARIAK